MKYVFTLTRAAKRSGGDRYETYSGRDPFFIYIPQNISRNDTGKVAEVVTVEFVPNFEKHLNEAK